MHAQVHTHAWSTSCLIILPLLLTAKRKYKKHIKPHINERVRTRPWNGLHNKRNLNDYFRLAQFSTRYLIIPHEPLAHSTPTKRKSYACIWAEHRYGRTRAIARTVQTVRTGERFFSVAYYLDYKYIFKRMCHKLVMFVICITHRVLKHNPRQKESYRRRVERGDILGTCPELRTRVQYTDFQLPNGADIHTSISCYSAIQDTPAQCTRHESTHTETQYYSSIQ